MDKWIGKVAVVTGASAGIGATVAIELAKHGVIVAGFARRMERVEQLAAKHKDTITKGQLVAVRCDVSRPESIKEAFKWVQEHLGGVDILINNAGIVRDTDILTHDDNTQDILDVINTNLTGLILCSQEAYRSLDKRDAYGYIVNINSVSGQTHHFDYKWRENVYPATKHGVTAVNEMLRTELYAKGNTKIRVTSISPGLVKTEIFDNAKDILDNNKDCPALDTQDMADAIIYLLSTKPHINIKELTIQVTGEEGY